MKVSAWHAKLARILAFFNHGVTCRAPTLFPDRPFRYLEALV